MDPPAFVEQASNAASNILWETLSTIYALSTNPNALRSGLFNVDYTALGADDSSAPPWYDFWGQSGGEKAAPAQNGTTTAAPPLLTYNPTHRRNAQAGTSLSGGTHTNAKLLPVQDKVAYTPTSGTIRPSNVTESSHAAYAANIGKKAKDLFWKRTTLPSPTPDIASYPEQTIDPATLDSNAWIICLSIVGVAFVLGLGYKYAQHRKRNGHWEAPQLPTSEELTLPPEVRALGAPPALTGQLTTYLFVDQVIVEDIIYKNAILCDRELVRDYKDRLLVNVRPTKNGVLLFNGRPIIVVRNKQEQTLDGIPLYLDKERGEYRTQSNTFYRKVSPPSSLEESPEHPWENLVLPAPIVDKAPVTEEVDRAQRRGKFLRRGKKML